MASFIIPTLLPRQMPQRSSTKPSFRPPGSTRPRAPKAPSMSSVKSPNYFSKKWYTQSVAPLDVEQAAHYIPNKDHQTDWHFIDTEHGLMAFVDYPAADQEHSPGRDMIQYIHQRLLQTKALYGPREPIIDLRTILSSALLIFGSTPGFSAIIVQISSTVMRATWVGSCGFVLVRDDDIHYRSYSGLGRVALEHNLQKPPASKDQPPQSLNDTTLPFGKLDRSIGGSTLLSLAASRDPHPESVDINDIQTDYLLLQDNDLVIAASDGLFANIDESQIIAFVRPVPDPNDPTLAIANNTCLGSWRNDDVEFISYYLANIASNFATAQNSTPYLPYPFPPSPHLDDVTVLCAASSFQE